VVVNRIGYGQRKITSLQPLDGELNLPPEKYSHGLSERVAEAVAFNGFEQTVEIIKKTTAAKVPKRQVEELARKSASDCEQFYQQQQTKINCPEKTGELMVITADGKGVVMRQEDLRPQTKKRAIESQKKHQKRLSKGEKRNSTRMATVGAVYTINRFRRTAEQIVNGEEKKSKSRKAPKPEGKRVWASLEKEPKTVITEIFEEAFSRDPGGEKNRVALVDGNKTQLQLIKNLAQKYQQSVTIVLDLIHVIEYIWKAAFVFHSPGTAEAENWVSEHLLEILKGKSSLVASRMRDDATLLELKPEQRSGVDKCVNYLLNNQPYLR
jgi:hypothetical protein